MNKIFKIVKNTCGDDVVVSELAKGHGKSIAALIVSAFLTGQVIAAPISIEGVSTSENAVSIGSGSYATSVNGVAHGDNAIATGGNISRDEFSSKLSEIDSLKTEKERKNAELHNLRNDQSINENTISSLEDQIHHVNDVINNMSYKTSEKERLLARKAELEAGKSELENNVNTATDNLNNILVDGKNVFLNFNNVLYTLNWSKLQDTNRNVDEIKIELADELKGIVDSKYSDLSNKYDQTKYLEIINGYINSKAAYEGFRDYFRSKLVENFGYGPDFSSHANVIESANITNDNEIPFFSAGELLHENSSYFSVNDDFKSKNTLLLFYKSKKDNPDSYLGEPKTYNFYLDANEFGLFYLKTKNKSINENYYDKIKPVFFSDFTIYKYSPYHSSNYTTNDPKDRSEIINEMESYINTVDWNDTNSVFSNLSDYKIALESSLNVFKKQQALYELHREIVNLSSISNPDTNLIARKTSELINLEREVNNLMESTPLASKFRFEFNEERINYEFNYSKNSVIDFIKEFNILLKRYNPYDSLIIETNEKSIELEKALETAKENLKNAESAISNIENQINNLGLTTEENEAANKKQELERQLEEAKAKKGEIEKSITDKESEMTELLERLRNSSLNDQGLNSQSYGHQAFASGDNAIAMGTNSTVTANDGIAIGQNTVVTGTNSVAVGKNSVVSGESSVAIGVGHNVSGHRSSTIGDPNTITGNDVFVAGNNNTVNSNEVMVVGNNINVAAGFNGAVVLGHGSTVSAASPVTQMNVRNKDYTVAGTNPTSVVSIGASGAERQIVNVAAGRVSSTSTDAINGSQLHALAEAVNNLETSAVAPADISDAIHNALKNNIVAGENVTIDEQENPDNGTKTFTINAIQPTIEAGTGVTINKNGNTLTFNVNPIVQNGNNLTITGGSDHVVVTPEGNNIKVDLSDNTKLAVEKVNQGITSTTDDGKTIKHQLGDTIQITGDGKAITTSTTEDGKISIGLSDKITVSEINVGTVRVDQKGINAGGQKITNVANGNVSAGSLEAVNGSQLYETNAQVVQNMQRIEHNTQSIERLNSKIDHVDKRAKRGTAIAGAIAMLPQPSLSGKSMLSAATTNYRGEQALAIGYSALSNNGKHIIKLSGSTNVSGKKDLLIGASYGYQW